jgi:hypothetical protein
MNAICYHLTIKKNYEKIKCNLENIIDSYKEINYISSSSNNNSSLDFNVNDDLTNYKKKLENVQLMIKIINNLLYITCKHNFVEDAIDITPDKSKNITYCSICECNKI